MDDLLAEINAKKRKLTNSKAVPLKFTVADERQEQLRRQRELDEKRRRRQEEREAKELEYEEELQSRREGQMRKWLKRSRPGTEDGQKQLGGVGGESGESAPAGTSTGDAESNEVEDSLSKLSVSEIKRALRRKGQPVTLYGESDVERLERLRTLETRELEEGAEDFRLNAGYEVTNTFLGDDDSDDEVRNGASREGRRTTGKADGSEDAVEQPKRPEIVTSDFSSQGLNEYKLVRKYFKFMMKQWELDLAARPDEVKASMPGKVESKTAKQCKEYIKPMFKLLKDKTINPSILDSLNTIVKSCERGDFRTAGDAYIKISIGNAPWPIGLTMVGIHERTGREKISSKNVAHIMNNELQRKYLTSVKRLMNYAQRRRPDVPPSMKVQN